MRSLFLYGDIGPNFDTTSFPFVEKAGGAAARIVVLGLRVPTWDVYFNRVFRERWVTWGTHDVKSITPDEHYEFDSCAYETLQTCTGLLICGGDTRQYYKACVSNVKMKETINDLYSRGAPIAGVSAGALIATSPCTIWGSRVTGANNKYTVRSKYDPACQEQELVTGEGLGLLSGCIVEPHFSEFGGFPRLVASMQKTSAEIGLGVDEPICLEITDEFRVVVHGTGRAYYIKKLTDDFTVRVFEPNEEFRLL